MLCLFLLEIRVAHEFDGIEQCHQSFFAHEEEAKFGFPIGFELHRL